MFVIASSCMWLCIRVFPASQVFVGSRLLAAASMSSRLGGLQMESVVLARFNSGKK